MASKLEEQMEKMVASVQPHCDEEIFAAMTCSHAGSMSAVLKSKLLGGIGLDNRSSELPNPVFIAVGVNTIYAFQYKPRGFKFKIKKEAARWPINEVKVTVEENNMMSYFNLSLISGENYPMEVPIMMGGRELVHLFLKALVKQQDMGTL